MDKLTNLEALIQHYAALPRSDTGLLGPAREELRLMRELLRRAGNALDIHSSQKVRSLRFQILDFLGRPDDGKAEA